MNWIDLTLASPEENLACDEALIDWCEDGYDHEILRFWEPTTHFVVPGYANKTDLEVNLSVCHARGIPVVRRTSGGGTVLQGPGCLNYALILRQDEAGPTHSITTTNSFVMERNREALQRLVGKPVRIEGVTDLAIQGRKFSGNAQRRRRRFLLFHGSFLLHADLQLLDACLAMPSRQPDYRRARPHAEFLVNVKLEAEQLKAALREAWDARVRLPDIPRERIDRLVHEKYARPDWNKRF